MAPRSLSCEGVIRPDRVSWSRVASSTWPPMSVGPALPNGEVEHGPPINGFYGRRNDRPRS